VTPRPGTYSPQRPARVTRSRVVRPSLRSAAGVLDGRRATTHWAYAARLAREYPSVP
jgi:hypothetical protein